MLAPHLHFPEQPGGKCCVQSLAVSCMLTFSTMHHSSWSPPPLFKGNTVFAAFLLSRFQLSQVLSTCLLRDYLCWLQIMPPRGTGDRSSAEVSIPTDQPAGGNVFTYTICFFTQ